MPVRSLVVQPIKQIPVLPAPLPPQTDGSMGFVYFAYPNLLIHRLDTFTSNAAAPAG